MAACCGVGMLAGVFLQLLARLACLSGELKLQAAPLTAMQLELTQAKLDTETMRERLKNHRKESRLRCALRNVSRRLVPVIELIFRSFS